MRARTIPVRNLDEVIRIIKREIERGKKEPVVRELVAKILARKIGDRWVVPPKNYEAEVKALFEYVQKNIRYTRDTYGIDTFQRALRTLQLKIADCDDMAILLGSMLQAAGYPIALKVVDTTGGGFSHIYLLAGVPPQNPTRWIPLDPTVDRPAGWEIKPVKAYRIFPIGGSPTPVSGTGVGIGDIFKIAPWWAWLALVVALYGFGVFRRLTS